MAAKEFTRPLKLTSPHEISKRVRDAQYLMQGHNRFKGLATYKDGHIDGEYGPVTAGATRRAKYWLGYPDRHVNSYQGLQFGQTLYEYLRPNDWRPLPEAFRQRRADRIAAVAKTIGDKALDVAITQIGYHETPWGSNNTKYGQWYGMNYQPWCAIFESWCFGQVGRNYRYSYVGNIVNDAISHRNGLERVWTPRRGDIACYVFGGHYFAHTAFFENWVDGNNFHDVGGNTGQSNVSNGGAVLRGVQSKSTVSHFVRVH